MKSPAELEKIALAVAVEAGEFLMTGHRSRPKARKKGAVDLVTEFDLGAEELIRRRLGELSPELPILAEEGGGALGDRPTWCCDPLDGTTNYVHGHPFWAVSVGVLAGSTPVAGAVVAPALGTTWSAHAGGVAFRNGDRCIVSETDRASDALVATGFPTDRTKEPDNNFRSFTNVKRAVRGVRRCGSAALDLCLVADGTYDGYWERKLHAWDVAAGAAVAIEAGARITSLDGGEPDYRIGHLLVTNGRIHAELRALVNDQKEPSLS